ncbi:MAG: phosphoribosylformylglycinamidine synthase subunit PurS [Firmicutes bacterium]|nr:phosphoribosylformylglycinamidine synthase subunit PurS [Bacillota bacterium]
MRWRAVVAVELKPGVLDPQGEAVREALRRMGHDHVSDVRVGKRIQLLLEAAEEGEARARVRDICESLLVNPVLERYAFDIEPEGER